MTTTSRLVAAAVTSGCTCTAADTVLEDYLETAARLAAAPLPSWLAHHPRPGDRLPSLLHEHLLLVLEKHCRVVGATVWPHDWPNMNY